MKPFGTIHSTCPARLRGFSLIEVMVALIIIAVGMLGIAKMQALGLSTTQSSGTRSLVAIEAASLAASMHSNRDYWVAGPPPASFTVAVATTGPNGATSVTITDATNTLNVAPTCGTTTACAAGSASQIAAYDVQQWAASLATVVPAAQATIACNTATSPLSCTIQIQWAENVTSTSNSAAASSSGANALNSPVYTLYVEP
ncbi:MAG TPA: prepilin-type N-terminal cleavage/methylation domain-containing protein [Steroidobacteraceae bacterium]|nr:prepilin-type N-terminal cleavage/methylation domain-containing protein [Steroidobacteraceae bacterium]